MYIKLTENYETKISEEQKNKNKIVMLSKNKKQKNKKTNDRRNVSKVLLKEPNW